MGCGGGSGMGSLLQIISFKNKGLGIQECKQEVTKGLTLVKECKKIPSDPNLFSLVKQFCQYF